MDSYESLQKAMQNEIISWMNFGSLWGAKLGPKWTQIGPKLEPKIDQTLIKKTSKSQDATRCG